MKHTVLKFTAALLCCLAMTAGNAYAQSFKEQAIKNILDGDLNKAETLLNNLSENEKKEHYILIDSLQRTIYRIRKDFSLSPDEGKRQISERMQGVTDEKIDLWKKKKYIEADTLDGKEMWFRRSIGNFFLLNNDDFSSQNEASRKQTYKYLEKYYNEAMATEADENGVRNHHKCQITFSIDVKADAVPDGETLRVWMPFPFENMRQSDIQLIKSSHDVTLSKNSLQHTAYMEGTAQKGKPTHFEITYSYIVGERHIDRAEILSRLKPYDKTSDTYKKYTSDEYPHIIKSDRMEKLARSIVGNEKNPVFQASIIYDWIVSNFPWAGAREYSTIPNIPEYVLDNGHGDCGQVTLLYIALVRSIGIPARWESGYMLYPHELNYHDWAETYFEGVGWVPTDVSFGRTMVGEPLSDYYKTGIDVYRFAANENTNQPFDPKKEFIRCETVDNQAGEVEWRGGNLEYKDFSSSLHIDSFIRIDKSKPEKEWGLVRVSVASMYTDPYHSAGMATQSTMGTPVKIIAKADDWYKVETPDTYVSYIPGYSLVMLDSTKLSAWKETKRYIVTAYQSQLTSEPKKGATVSDLVMGDILEYKGEKSKYVMLATPDGREGYVPKSDVEELSSWAAQAFDVKKVESTARRMMGSPYFWGGTSTKMTDCSGLSKISYFSNGVIIMRDAWQQALTGNKIAAADWRQARTGDLLFFGTRSGRVTHVAIYLDNGKYIHCSGRVKINSVDPEADDYLSTPFLSISRIDGQIGTKGITTVREHPWYFLK